MHVHELNPWKTLITLSLFAIILIIGFLTMSKPLISYQLNMEQSIKELTEAESYFYPWELEDIINQKTESVVLFDIRDHFVFGQGHIPGAENLSAHDLTLEQNIERLENLKKQGITVVLYGEDQLQANGPWMLLRHVGFDNIKILVGGFQYYESHKDNLAECKTDNSFLKGMPKYDFADMAAPKDGSIISTTTARKPVEVRRKTKTAAAAGGC